MKSADQKDHAPSRQIVVAIGASAGGLRPLQELFAALPIDLGMSFIVVQHLSPDFDSVMDELLARHTAMPIKTAEQGMRLEPNTVFLNPAGMDIEIVDHQIELRPFDPSALRLPINSMFQVAGERVRLRCRRRGSFGDRQ